MEEVDLIFGDTTLFVWKERTQIEDNGVSYYLNQVHFSKNRNGALYFQFPNGESTRIQCVSTKPANGSSKVNRESTNAQLNDEWQSAIQNNTNVMPQALNPPQSLPTEVFDVSLTHDQSSPTPERIPSPKVLDNGTQLPWDEPVVVNILLLVPDKKEYIELASSALLKLGFTKEVSSETQQQLYRESDLIERERRVLLFPYGNISRSRKLPDYLPRTSEAIVLIENEREQNDNLMAITRVHNVKTAVNNNVTDVMWQFVLKTGNFGALEFEYSTLSPTVQKRSLSISCQIGSFTRE
eukprot:TRINITY_DN13528_c0_g1_i1.p1 TRINITY_DN13528_c0_g1~~TRINITY_DN13528_c0_g1_i1.p1  ORF type:complete len:305 (+),score=21.84 TRINITY_DN13528_c0_g1_i1:28-915(+)